MARSKLKCRAVLAEEWSVRKTCYRPHASYHSSYSKDTITDDLSPSACEFLPKSIIDSPFGEKAVVIGVVEAENTSI
jgi:hypothetical protein